MARYTVASELKVLFAICFRHDDLQVGEVTQHMAVNVLGCGDAAAALAERLPSQALMKPFGAGRFGKPRAPFAEALRQCCQALMAVIASRDIVARRPMEIPEPEAANMLRVVVSLLVQPMAVSTLDIVARAGCLIDNS